LKYYNGILKNKLKTIIGIAIGIIFIISMLYLSGYYNYVIMPLGSYNPLPINLLIICIGAILAVIIAGGDVVLAVIKGFFTGLIGGGIGFYILYLLYVQPFLQNALQMQNLFISVSNVPLTFVIPGISYGSTLGLIGGFIGFIIVKAFIDDKKTRNIH
jgi:hypothetical protein